MTTYEKEFLNKYDSKQEFTENEIQEAIWDGLDIIEEQHGNNRRWTREETVIVKAGERYFKLRYEQGLTECQENEYYTDVKEVENRKKVITVNEWVEI